ncbi:MAG: 50S ribosomal protein L21 [Deltaproteobacteria bacterium]|nr:50S ribosomal protein L21 [Deltaproteobacteria bacterium]
MYAIIATGGKQYRVAEGEWVRVEKLVGDVGQKIVFDSVLMLGGEGAAKIGKPSLGGASVEAEITAQARGRKLIIYTYKAKKNERRKHGHRQPYTELRITKITG